MRISLITPALLLAMGAFACGVQRTNTPAPRPRATGMILARDAPRCYAIRASASLYYAPPRIRLETTPVADIVRHMARDSAWELTRLDAQGGAIVEERRQPILYWAAAPPDSIRIIISTGFSGSELIVGAAGGADTLRGRAVEFWDVGPSENNAGPVTLAGVPCVTG
jgi:hypothetical protein